MKYFISYICILISLSAYATRIMIHYEKGNELNSSEVQSIFKDQYNIPQSLIQRKLGKCNIERKDRRFLHLCINKKGELLTLSPDIHFKIKSLSTFKLLQE